MNRSKDADRVNRRAFGVASCVFLVGLYAIGLAAAIGFATPAALGSAPPRTSVPLTRAAARQVGVSSSRFHAAHNRSAGGDAHRQAISAANAHQMAMVMRPSIKFASVRRSVAGVPFAGNDITFVAQNISADAIPEQSAIASAEQIHGPVRVDSSYTAEAEFGTLTDSDIATMGSDGNVVLKYVDTPVWVVTFVSPKPIGTSYHTAHGTVTYSKSQWTFFVDAYSGETLLGI